MARKLTTTQRHRRQLRVPAPERKGNLKVSHAGWLQCARVVLIEEGIGRVKVDRMARRLKVTRGGFYHQFTSHHALLEALLELWRTQNIFVAKDPDVSTPQAAFAALQLVTDVLIHEKGFDPQFDMAVREWARISAPVARVVQTVDEQRIASLRRILLGLGCAPKEADIRAKVFYYHQIGYYALGVEESVRGREDNVPVYLSVLCGDSYTRAARAHAALPRGLAA